MQARALAIPDAYEFIPTTFPDDRGVFTAPFQEPTFVKTVGHRLNMAQTNHSVSRRGTIRGVHFADVPPGQAKYIYCPQGALLDVLVDIRVGSPTFGRWDAVRLSAHDFRAVYAAEGIGHAFLALEDGTAMNYLCSVGYRPAAEHTINPLDKALDLPWPADLKLILSERDQQAPTLSEALAAGLLPNYADCVKHYERLRRG